jgi:hypothetical protein
VANCLGPEFAGQKLVSKVKCGFFFTAAAAAGEGDGGGQEGAAGSSEGQQPPRQQAMRLALTQRPQDGSADAAVHLILAPSYVTYSPATVARVADFFRTDEVGCLFRNSCLAEALSNGATLLRRGCAVQLCRLELILEVFLAGAGCCPVTKAVHLWRIQHHPCYACMQNGRQADMPSAPLTSVHDSCCLQHNQAMQAAAPQARCMTLPDLGRMCAQVLDLSALGAQAIARVEAAQRAARDQLAAAMHQRPKLALKLELEGPKVAVPVPASGGQGAPRARMHACAPCSACSLCLHASASFVQQRCHDTNPHFLELLLRHNHLQIRMNMLILGLG